MNAAEWELMIKARDMLVSAPHGAKAEVTARAAQMLGQKEIVQAATEALAKLPPEKFKRTR